MSKSFTAVSCLFTSLFVSLFFQSADYHIEFADIQDAYMLRVSLVFRDCGSQLGPRRLPWAIVG